MIMNTENKQTKAASYFKITNVDAMEPFFMNVVSGTDLWTFMSSNGGITAGRRSADWALFPYETDDREHRQQDTCASCRRQPLLGAVLRAQ